MEWLVLALGVTSLVIGCCLFAMAVKRFPPPTEDDTLHVVEGARPPQAAASRVLEDFYD